jgi:hypothetical protein
MSATRYRAMPISITTDGTADRPHRKPQPQPRSQPQQQIGKKSETIGVGTILCTPHTS